METIDTNTQNVQTPHSRTLLLWGNNASYFTSCELPILGGEQVLNSHDIFSRDNSLFSEEHEWL